MRLSRNVLISIMFVSLSLFSSCRVKRFDATGDSQTLLSGTFSFGSGLEESASFHSYYQGKEYISSVDETILGDTEVWNPSSLAWPGIAPVELVAHAQAAIEAVIPGASAWPVESISLNFLGRERRPYYKITFFTSASPEPPGDFQVVVTISGYAPEIKAK